MGLLEYPSTPRLQELQKLKGSRSLGRILEGGGGSVLGACDGLFSPKGGGCLRSPQGFQGFRARDLVDQVGQSEKPNAANARTCCEISQFSPFSFKTHSITLTWAVQRVSTAVGNTGIPMDTAERKA